ARTLELLDRGTALIGVGEARGECSVEQRGRVAGRQPQDLLLVRGVVARVRHAPRGEPRAVCEASEAIRAEEPVLLFEIRAGAGARPPRERRAVDRSALRLLQDVVVLLAAAACRKPPGGVGLPVETGAVEARLVVGAIDQGIVVADRGVVELERPAERANRTGNASG